VEELDYAVYVGALRRLKGIYTVLDAAERLPNLRILLIGEGEEETQLRQEVVERNLTNVTLTGHMSGPDFRRTVAQSRFVLVPSELYENCPMVALEAFAMGKPVIGARIGGIPELVEDHATGLLFESGDADDLAEKMTYLDERPDLRYSLGQEGRRRVEQDFGVDKHYAGLMDIYERVMENHGRSH
jgi:glycosyltransferase involved in cell wall biosynthesis